MNGPGTSSPREIDANQKTCLPAIHLRLVLRKDTPPFRRMCRRRTSVEAQAENANPNRLRIQPAGIARMHLDRHPHPQR